MNNDFWSRVRWFASGFPNDEVKSEDHWQITTRVKSLFTVTNYFFLFLTCHLIFWTHNSATNNHRSLILPSSLRTVLSVLELWRHHSWSMTSHDLEVWRHIRLFVECHCRCKLARRRFSLVNDNREYRFFTTRYSRPRVSIKHCLSNATLNTNRVSPIVHTMDIARLCPYASDVWLSPDFAVIGHLLWWGSSWMNDYSLVADPSFTDKIVLVLFRQVINVEQLL